MQCHDRTEGFLQALIPEVEKRFDNQHKRILLVSHAATIIALSRTLAGDRQLPLRVGCCSLTEFHRQHAGESPLEGWETVRLADGSPLKDGSTRDWGFEDIVVADGQASVFICYQYEPY